MRWLRMAGRRLGAAIFPWPGVHEREQAIADARKGREHSQAQAQQAKVIEGQVKRMAAENHFAESIARDILRGRR